MHRVLKKSSSGWCRYTRILECRVRVCRVLKKVGFGRVISGSGIPGLITSVNSQLAGCVSGFCYLCAFVAKLCKVLTVSGLLCQTKLWSPQFEMSWQAESSSFVLNKSLLLPFNPIDSKGICRFTLLCTTLHCLHILHIFGARRLPIR